MRGQIEAQKLDVEALAYRAEQNRKLRAGGFVSEATFRAAEVEAKKAKIQLAQLQGSVAEARRVDPKVGTSLRAKGGMWMVLERV